MLMEGNGREYRREFWGLAWPAAVEGLLLMLLSSVDLIMVGRLGAEATSAVGIFAQPKMVLLCVPRSLAVAVSARIAFCHGRGAVKEQVQTMKLAAAAIAGGAAVLTAAAFAQLRPFLLLAGTEPQYLEMAEAYAEPMLVSLYLTSVSIVLHGGLLGIGNTKLMMTTNVLGNLTNIAANALLIYGIGPFPSLGVRGAGIGTVCGSFLTLLLTIIFMKKESGGRLLSGGDGWKLSRRELWTLGRDFAGVLTEQGAERVGMFLYSRMAAGLGVVPFAVHTVCMSLCDFYYSFCQGLGKASLALSGKWKGKEEPKVFRSSMKAGQMVGLRMSAAACFLYMILRTPLLELYQSDKSAVLLGGHIMLLVAVVSFPEAQSLICSGALRGAGQIHYVAAYSLVSIAVIRPIVTWILCYRLGMGLYGAWISLFMDQCIRAGCASWRLKRISGG